jgi:hypothetical protein
VSCSTRGPDAPRKDTDAAWCNCFEIVIDTRIHQISENLTFQMGHVNFNFRIGPFARGSRARIPPFCTTYLSSATAKSDLRLTVWSNINRFPFLRVRAVPELWRECLNVCGKLLEGFAARRDLDSNEHIPKSHRVFTVGQPVHNRRFDTVTRLIKCSER